MTFLNPLVLFGLAAAAIPVILHLLNLRKLKTIEFSTLTFLKELQQTKIRRLRIRQLLLLLIRTLIVAFIVLAFARPALRGRILGTIGSHAHSTVVFILDDSFSLAVSDEHGSRLKQLKDAALKFLDVLRDGDEVFLIKLSDLPKVTVEPALHDFQTVRTIIQEMQISIVRRPLDEALRVSARLLSRSTNANKEVYVISDLQRTLLMRESGSETQLLPLFDERVKFFIVPVGSKPIANAAIDSTEVISKILEKNKPVKVYASVRNFSSLPLRDYVVSIFLDKVRAAQTNVSVEPFGTASLEFTITPKRSGDVGGYVELENDAIEFDNRKYFLLRIPEKLNVALLTGHQPAGDYLLTALRSAAASGDQSPLHIEELSEERFPLLDLKNTDVLMCSDVKAFSKQDAHRLKDFVSLGGGMIIFPGDDIDRENYNSVLFPLLQIPAIGSITHASSPQMPLSFKGIDLDHPLFETIFERELHGRRREGVAVESPHIMTALGRQTGKQGRQLIGLSDGGAFLSEYGVGQGRVLVYSVAPSLAWSDFPLTGIFAPLVYRSVMFAGIAEEAGRSYTTGDAPIVTLKGSRSGGAQFKLVGPDGVEELLQSSPAGRTNEEMGVGRSFAVKPFLLPGIFELKNENTRLASIVVNVDSREGDTRPASREELDEFWKRMSIPESAVQPLDGQAYVQDAVVQSRFGVELWRYCAVIALLLAILEMGVARDSSGALDVRTA